jgi:integrase/recombinase XerD
VAKQFPEIKKKKVSPYTIRYTIGTHLLQAGIDINTMRVWLGHVSINTTNIYAEADLEMKARALACCEMEQKKRRHTGGIIRI